MIEKKTIAEKEKPKEGRIQFYKIWNYRNFLLLIIVGAMINNLDHSAELYMKISERVSVTQAYSVVIIFDLIVIALIGVGDSKALLFAISVFFINELAWDGVKVFYQIWMKAKDVNYVISDAVSEYLTLIEKAITMLIYGGTFAFTVHHFSYLFKKQLAKKSKFNSLLMEFRTNAADINATNNELSSSLSDSTARLKTREQELAVLEQSRAALEQRLSAAHQQIKKQSTELEGLRKFKSVKLAELTCTCGKEFNDIGAKFGHQRRCDIYKNKY